VAKQGAKSIQIGQRVETGKRGTRSYRFGTAVEVHQTLLGKRIWMVEWDGDSHLTECPEGKLRPEVVWDA
jgi:hypothetical protein